MIFYALTSAVPPEGGVETRAKKARVLMTPEGPSKC